MAAQASPVTGVIDENEVVLDFGDYEGRSVKDIADLDPNFYSELIKQKDLGSFSIRRHHDKSFRLYLNPLSKVDH